MEIFQERKQFIATIGELATEDWKKRHLCLPSLVTAIAIEGSNWGTVAEAIEQKNLFPSRHDRNNMSFESWKQAIELHNDYIASWRLGRKTQPNWKDLIGEHNYIFALHYLQYAKHPYYPFRYYETKLVNLIEKFELTSFDR